MWHVGRCELCVGGLAGSEAPGSADLGLHLLSESSSDLFLDLASVERTTGGSPLTALYKFGSNDNDHIVMLVLIITNTAFTSQHPPYHCTASDTSSDLQSVKRKIFDIFLTWK